MATGKPYDATTKVLLGTRPQDWVAFFGFPANVPVELVDTDISTVSAAADGVLRIGGQNPELLHIEFESGHTGRQLPGRLLRYNVLLNHAFELPVRSIAILLASGADSRSLTGDLEHTRPDGTVYLAYRYEVVRVWQCASEDFLGAGLSLLPLAPIAQVTEDELPAVIDRIDSRLQAALSANEIIETEVRDLWTATFLLMGTRYTPELATRLLQKVKQMRESSTYQFILDEGRSEGRSEGHSAGHSEGLSEGRAEEARRIVWKIGIKRFGEPSDGIRKAIEAITSVDVWEQMADRLLEVENWDELLAAA